ncbi:MAG TPA: hypothetical protein VFG71_00300 [Nitrospiraceae bacterium]|nr:hypothetical protein [Nitrospiraceae bacterium]
MQRVLEESEWSRTTMAANAVREGGDDPKPMRLPASSIQEAPSPHFRRAALDMAMSRGEKRAKSHISPAGSAASAIRIEEIHEEDVPCLFPTISVTAGLISDGLITRPTTEFQQGCPPQGNIRRNFGAEGGRSPHNTMLLQPVEFPHGSHWWHFKKCSEGYMKTVEK